MVAVKMMMTLVAITVGLAALAGAIGLAKDALRDETGAGSA
jgi:hypothetical protein